MTSVENNCGERPCREVTALRDRFESYREETNRRLAAGDVSMATINTKLNWLIGLLSSIGAAVLAAVIKILIG